MKTLLSSKGQIVLPADFRHQDDLRPGQEFEIKRIGRGKYLLQRKSRPKNDGLVKLLLDCPVKDWFEPLERSETTDDIDIPKLG
jgi:AbrB family looped-hinge helix DNA binding protein